MTFWCSKKSLYSVSRNSSQGNNKCQHNDNHSPEGLSVATSPQTCILQTAVSDVVIVDSVKVQTFRTSNKTLCHSVRNNEC